MHESRVFEILLRVTSVFPAFQSSLIPSSGSTRGRAARKKERRLSRRGPGALPSSVLFRFLVGIGPSASRVNSRYRKASGRAEGSTRLCNLADFDYYFRSKVQSTAEAIEQCVRLGRSCLLSRGCCSVAVFLCSRLRCGLEQPPHSFMVSDNAAPRDLLKSR